MRKELLALIIVSIIVTLSSFYFTNNANGMTVKHTDRIDCVSYYKAVDGLTKLMNKHSIDDIMFRITSICEKYARFNSVICEQDVLSYMRFMMEMIDEYDIKNIKCYVSSSYENELYSKIFINTLALEISLR
jgi:hypothetical protein